MKDIQELEPIKKPHNNRNFTAVDCIDLPATSDGTRIYSIWKMGSLWQRLCFLFDGEITLIILGTAQHPVCLVRGDSVERLLSEVK